MVSSRRGMVVNARAVVTRSLLLAAVGVLLSQPVAAQHSLTLEERSAFRHAVDEYQIFVVPHCAPDEVRAYVAARADRDRAFVQSLRKTALEGDYKQAVADRAEQDSHTLYECMGPPPPPPPPPGTASPPTPARTEPQHQDTLAEHFAAGDRQFSAIVQLRDVLIGSRHK